MKKNTLLIFLFFVIYCPVSAQIGSAPITSPTTQKVEILWADSLTGTPETRKLMGNVRLKQKDVLMFCSVAFIDVQRNTFDAFGKVKMVQGDTLTLTGDSLYYDGNNRFARVIGRVVLNDRKVKLQTHRLNYNLNTGNVDYPEKGKIFDQESILNSKKGTYNTKTKIFNFRNEVEITHPKYTLTTDSLDYHSNIKTAYFISPATIVNKDGTMLAKAGSYNTETGASNFRGRSQIDNEEYTLVGDSLSFDKASELGFAKGNVELISKKNKVILTGDVGIRNGKTGFAKIYGHALMRDFSAKDTLFLRADTLFSVENKEKNTRKMIAQQNVKVFRVDMQSKCDSLIYNVADSAIHFFKKPIIWANANQLEADSMRVLLSNNKVRTMFLLSRSFVIAQDTARNFNQIKGRKIVAHFGDNARIDQVDVEGNGESLYFALDSKNKIVGLNKVECSRMNLKFKESKMNRVMFLGKPEAVLYPPKDISSDRTQLDDFNWRISEKPKKDEIIGKKIAAIR